MSRAGKPSDNERYRSATMGICVGPAPTAKGSPPIDLLEWEWSRLKETERRIEAIFAEAHAFFARYDRGEPQPPNLEGMTYANCERAMEDYERRVELSKHEEPFDTSKYIVSYQG